MTAGEWLARELATYERERNRLEAEYKEKFVVIQADRVVAAFDNFQDAAEEALRQFESEPFLIRRVPDAGVKLSVAVLYGLTHGGDPVHLQNP